MSSFYSVYSTVGKLSNISVRHHESIIRTIYRAASILSTTCIVRPSAALPRVWYRPRLCVCGSDSAYPRHIKIISRNMAGHSHWANIKFKKMHADNKRSKIFGKLTLEIATAVRENGPNPDMNPKLEALLIKAKSVNMPKDNIEVAIKNGVKDKNSPRQRLIVEVRGPDKSAFLVELLTINPVKAKNEIRAILRKNGAVVSDRGSVHFLFKEKGLIRVTSALLESIKDKDTTDSVEEILDQAAEIAISVNAEEVLPGLDEDGSKVLMFLCDHLETESVADLLEKEESVVVKSKGIEFVAHDTVILSDDAIHKIDKLVNTLNEYDDVVNIYDNVENYPTATCKVEKSNE